MLNVNLTGEKLVRRNILIGIQCLVTIVLKFLIQFVLDNVIPADVSKMELILKNHPDPIILLIV